MKKMHRAQILLDPDQRQKLAEMARREGTSISELVRQAVNQMLTDRRQDEVMSLRLRALEQIEQHRQAILSRRKGRPLEVDLLAALDQIREERDNELLANPNQSS